MVIRSSLWLATERLRGLDPDSGSQTAGATPQSSRARFPFHRKRANFSTSLTSSSQGYGGRTPHCKVAVQLFESLDIVQRRSRGLATIPAPGQHAPQGGKCENDTIRSVDYVRSVR